MIKIFIILFSIVFPSDLSLESTIEENYSGDDPNIYFSMYKVCLANDDIGCASANLNKAIKLDPKNEDYKSLSFSLQDYLELLNRANKTIERELYQEAIRDYNNIISEYPDRALSYYKRGEIYRTLENYIEAIADFSKASELNSSNEIYSKAIFSIAQRISKEADQAAKRQDYNTAIPKYLEAISYYPEFTQAYFNLAKSFYVLTDYDNAKKYLLKNVEVDNNQPQSLKMLADIYRKERNLSDAIIYYKRAVEVDPNYYKAYYSLATSLISSDINESKIYLKKVISINPDYEKAYETLGILNMQLELFEDAISNFLTSVSLNEGNYKSYYLLAEIYNSNKEYQTAKDYAKKAIDKNKRGTLGAAWYHLGIAEKNLKNKAAAQDAFEVAKRDKDWRASAVYELDLLSKGK